MKRLFFAMAVVGGALVSAAESEKEYRQLPVKTYVDKMAAGWIGQMAGVGWGAPTEFRFKGAIIPENKMPAWKPVMVNQFQQDDIYVEMTFLRSMELHGFDVSIRQAGVDFANSGYRLWHANRYGRENLRSGIAPPDSGHPKFNAHADDIDYQIEADYAGLIAPGMPNVAISLGEKFGRLMNYGDGLYGGQFVAGMYAEAFFEDDPERIVQAGLACIPAKSQYAEAIRDVLRWHAEQPDDWQATWRRIDAKFQRNRDYRRFSCRQTGGFNIDAKINGTYIVMGLLFGNRDLDNTIVIATRCGLDSDCNPSSAAGILFTTQGLKNLPLRFTSALDHSTVYSHTTYDFDHLLDVCQALARQAVVRQGGRIEHDAEAGDVFLIPVVKPRPSPLEQCWAPGSVANSRFTKQEMTQIHVAADPVQRDAAAGGTVDITEAVARFAPGWTVNNCGKDMQPGLRAAWGGRTNVLVTHPASRTKPCTLSRQLHVPLHTKTTLVLDVAHDPRGDWTLVVRADDEQLVRQKISGPPTLQNGNTAKVDWTTVTVDLSALAGKTATIVLDNRADGWQWEAAYWARIAIANE